MKRKKEYAPGDPWRNALIASFGNKYPLAMINFVGVWNQLLFELMPEGQYNAEAMEYYGFSKQLVDERMRELSAEIAQEIKTAIKKKDGSFFRLFADVIENQHEQADSVRQWLITLCFTLVPPRKQIRKFTTRRLVEMFEKHGWHITQRQMDALCDQLGIIREKGKEGRPKTRRNSKR